METRDKMYRITKTTFRVIKNRNLCLNKYKIKQKYEFKSNTKKMLKYNTNKENMVKLMKLKDSNTFF